MKKKYRDITVDGVKYTWNVRNGWNWGVESSMELIVTIWLNKKIIYQEKSMFPKLSLIKPSDIAGIIKEKMFCALNVKWSNSELYNKCILTNESVFGSNLTK